MVINCSRCHRLTRASPQGLCPECQQAEDRDLDAVLAYLHRHPQLTAAGLARSTGVPIERILRWVRQGRLLATRAGSSAPPSSLRPPQPASFHAPPARRTR